MHVWTGSATASALVMYMQNLQAMGVIGWDDRQTVAGVYSQHETGRVINFSFQYLYGADATFMRMIQSATAINVKIDHSSPANGSGGLLLRSAVVSNFALMGNENNPFAWAIQGFAHDWSHYGNG